VSAAAAVRELALRIGAGVATTCMGKGLFPDDHPLSLGIAFSDAAVTALREADVCLAVGCRFTQIATRDWSVRPPADLIHLDIDATVIDLHFPARVPLVADARVALEALSGQLPNPCPPERAEWAARVRELRRRDRVADSPEAAFCGLLRRAIPPEAVVVGDVASMVYHMFRHFDAYEPASFLYPSGYIAMGYGLPASIGSQLARPGACVVCIAGDGSLAMSLAELATAAQESCPLKIILLNNGCLGSIAHFAGGELPDLRSVVRLRNPDFVGLARSFGIPATQVDGADPGVTEQAVSRLTQQEGIGLVEVRLPSLA
jgi:acetolactate synthase-1/2/3 large subunit